MIDALNDLDYDAFLDRKAQLGTMHGFTPAALPSFLFDFQAALVEWALRKGRAAILADCGLGKGAMLLAWANAIVERENQHVLVLSPLAVSAQLLREAEKFGIAAVRSSDGTVPTAPTIVLTNYERLHHFDPNDFVGVVCDESSILKSFDGVRRGDITAFMRKRPYRLLCSATAAPNDYTELGTSSEALGELGYVDMLNRFFKNDLNNSSTGRGYLGAANQWRFKGHAETPFWRWVASWARAIRKPSDLGFDDARFILPALEEREHVLVEEYPPLPEGCLLPDSGTDLHALRAARRRTVNERCDVAASLVVDTGEPALLWCHLNDEGDRLERVIPGAVQVSGRDDDDAKEEKLLAFARGEVRVLVTKPKIGAWGLNLQHCAHVTVFPSYSYEQYYQAIRRCWRFGQERAVRVDHVACDVERGVMEAMQRKAASASAMFDALRVHMHDALVIDRARHDRAVVEVPSWL